MSNRIEYVDFIRNVFIIRLILAVQFFYSEKNINLTSSFSMKKNIYLKANLIFKRIEQQQ
jgi:hypothetical protein